MNLVRGFLGFEGNGSHKFRSMKYPDSDVQNYLKLIFRKALVVYS